MTDRPRIFLARALPLDPGTVLGESYDVRVFGADRSPTRDELREGARDAHALVSLLSDPVDAALLAEAPNLRIVANYAVGYDNVDVAEATRRGIWVTNTPGALTEATADLTWALLLAVARRVPEGDRMMRERGFAGWAPSLLLGRELHGATLGLFGFGRIGRAVARRARGFGMEVLFTARSPVPAEVCVPLGATQVDKATLIARSDVISLHCPLNAESRHAFGEAELGSMRPGAILVNTARGPVVDEAALVRALEAGHLGGAGLDVFEREPEVHPGLVGRDDVVLLPHVGSGTVRTRRRMAEMVLRDVRAVLEGGVPDNPVNRVG